MEPEAEMEPSVVMEPQVGDEEPEVDSQEVQGTMEPQVILEVQQEGIAPQDVIVAHGVIEQVQEGIQGEIIDGQAVHIDTQEAIDAQDMEEQDAMETQDYIDDVNDVSVFLSKLKCILNF